MSTDPTGFGLPSGFEPTTSPPDTPTGAPPITTAFSPTMAGISTTNPPPSLPSPTWLTPNTPPKPRIGGLSIGAEVLPWTGGKPNVQWTALANDKARKASPNCVRPIRTSDVTKSWNHRTAPPSKLFKKDDPDYELHNFRFDVLAHFKDSGMDTVMYVQSLSDPNVMVSVINDFEQVTLSHVTSQSLKYYPLFDDYDAENDQAGRLYLEACLAPSLQTQLRLRLMPEDTSAITWMRILHLVSDGSVERFNRKKEELKSLTPLKEPGENIVLYTDKVRRICMDLENAHQFEWVLMLAIVKALSQVTVESFRALWHPKRLSLDAALSECAFLAKDAANREMISKGYHYSTILTLAEDTYRSLLNNGDWHPASVVKDAQQAPSAFHAGMDLAAFNALVQSTVDRRINAANLGGPSGNVGNICFNCNKPGHFANSCPEPKREMGGDWRQTGPKPGEPTTKVRGSKTFQFCLKCKGGKGFWQSSHTTETHQAGAGIPRIPQPLAPVAAVAAVAPEAPVAGANLAALQGSDGLGVWTSHQF
jgi:Zinc knuckle